MGTIRTIFVFLRGTTTESRGMQIRIADSQDPRTAMVVPRIGRVRRMEELVNRMRRLGPSSRLLEHVEIARHAGVR